LHLSPNFAALDAHFGSSDYDFVEQAELDSLTLGDRGFAERTGGSFSIGLMPEYYRVVAFQAACVLGPTNHHRVLLRFVEGLATNRTLKLNRFLEHSRRVYEHSPNNNYISMKSSKQLHFFQKEHINQ